MNFNQKLMILLLLFVALLCINSVAAENINHDNLTQDSSNLEIDDGNKLTVSSDDKSVLGDSKTIIVDGVGENHNEMNEKTIRSAINNASDGDTIIINGKYYEHCHIIVNKKLTIVGNGTTLSPCSSDATSLHQGIFYISSKGSGTVIEGFTFVDNLGLSDDEAYGVLVNGASEVVIRDCNISTGDMADSIRFENAKNCLVQNVVTLNSVNGIKIKNSQNTTINNSTVINSRYGANIINSNSTTISNCNISGNNIAGIAFSAKSSYLRAIYNNITKNGNGINLTSSEYVYILSNYISFNNQNGVYVDCNITKIEIKGNFFNQNAFYEVYDDFHVQNLNQNGAEKLQIITNNYMIGKDDLYDRPIWRQVYDNTGTEYIYDAEKDVYVYVGSGNGNYGGHQTSIYLGYIFQINEYMECPNIYAKYYKSGVKPWSQDGNYYLYLSNITQIKKGVYSISIVDVNGNIASDLSSVPITFYLNKASVTNSPQEGDFYKTVMMVNGTATVKFSKDDFNQTGNVIMACAPGFEHNAYFVEIPYKTLAIDDKDIPGNISETKITVLNLNTYPNSNQELIVTLTDLLKNPIANQQLTFSINSITSNVTTDANGQAKIRISQAKEGTYILTVKYAGDETDHASSSANATVIVKKIASKIISSNLNMIPKKSEYYSVTLKDESGNPLANQRVTFKLNGKTYSRTTDSKGVAKVNLKFSKNKKTYKITVSFAGNNKYKSFSKTNKILVKYSSKTAKLTAPDMVVPLKTYKYYTMTLKNENGAGISKQKVVVKINGKKYTKKTNSKGQIKIKVKFSKVKSYKVTASYKGSKIYKKATFKGKIIADKTDTVISVPILSTFPNKNNQYCISLKSVGGKSLSKQSIKIVLDGRIYLKNTDSKGQVVMPVSFSNEKYYSVIVEYNGNSLYKPSQATGYINVFRQSTDIVSYNHTFSKDVSDYIITLKDSNNNAIANQAVSYTLNNQSYLKTTDNNGQIKVDISALGVGTYNIVSNYAQTNQYKASFNNNTINIVDRINTVFIDADIPNSEIQQRLDMAADGNKIEFLGQNYSDISLTVNKAVNISSNLKTVLNAKRNSPVFTINNSGVNVSNLVINGNSYSGIVVCASNVVIKNNTLSNILNQSKLPSYNNATLALPGFGIDILNSHNVKVYNNTISSYFSGIFAKKSDNLEFMGNEIFKNNYGITYGVNVSNTKIINNSICKNIGLYVMNVPEGPLGYGIFLNNSAVNVSIQNNNVSTNYMGISIDCNYSTGIVITSNLICDNALEGIRFNAGYDLAKNAVEPIVTDNAIYRNAVGPSMMILGEMSANPAGIYGGALTNASLKLKIAPNWYGKNQIVTWDNDTGIVGFGTMCPRINTTGIAFNDIVCTAPGTYSITFYKNGEIATNLPVFEMYASINNNTEKLFYVVDGIGSVTFNASDFSGEDNEIEISIGSLKSTTRYFEILMSKKLNATEILN